MEKSWIYWTEELIKLKLRKATIDDIWDLVRLRKIQLVDEGQSPDTDVDQEMYEFFRKRFDEGSIIQYVIEDGREIVATGAVIFYDFPPSFTNVSGKRAYIANIYTKDEYRGRGLATKILTKLVEESKTLGISRVWLEASEMGRPVYLKFGFKEKNKFLELDI